MAAKETFLSPVFTGKRFNDHTIPVELLEDFPVIEDLLIELAKWLYLQDNPGKKRVPNGFATDVTLKLASTESGSFIPNFLLAFATLAAQSNSNAKYYTKAKENIVYALDAASNNTNISNYLPEQFSVFFNRIGSRLKDDESINFSPKSNLKAILNKDTRRAIILSSTSIAEIRGQTTVRASITQIDKGNQTFTIKMYNGQKITANLKSKFRSIALTDFNNFDSDPKFSISGIGIFNRLNKLIGFELIDNVILLDKLDVDSRLEELSYLKDGWLNGEGTAMDKLSLLWFSKVFKANYDSSLQLPHIYPTPTGDIQAEWSIGDVEVSLNISLLEKSGFYQSLNVKTNSIYESEYSLDETIAWLEINQKLSSLINPIEN